MRDPGADSVLPGGLGAHADGPGSASSCFACRRCRASPTEAPRAAPRRSACRSAGRSRRCRPSIRASAGVDLAEDVRSSSPPACSPSRGRTSPWRRRRGGCPGRSAPRSPPRASRGSPRGCSRSRREHADARSSSSGCRKCSVSSALIARSRSLRSASGDARPRSSTTLSRDAWPETTETELARHAERSGERAGRPRRSRGPRSGAARDAHLPAVAVPPDELGPRGSGRDPETEACRRLRHLDPSIGGPVGALGSPRSCLGSSSPCARRRRASSSASSAAWSSSRTRRASVGSRSCSLARVPR